MGDPEYILFFDGECVLCNSVVQWIIPRDPNRNFSFATLRGETAQRLRKEFDAFPEGLDTFVLFDNGVIRVRSNAVLAVARHLTIPWRWGSIFVVLPLFVRDAVYRWIAKNRLSWFGRQDQCWLAPDEELTRFLP